MAQYQQSQMPIQPNATYQSPPHMNEKMSGVPAPAYGHEHKQGGAVSKWSFGMFDCCAPMSTCCLGFWCPCYLFGKTSERNKTGEKDPSGFNGMCAAYCLVGWCGFASCFQCVTRGHTRDKYNIEGNMVGDFCASFWCGCCTLIQEDKESIVRQTGVDPKTKQAYQPVGQMSYA